MEIWKQVIGYETRYEVSNLGNVRSVAQKIIMKNGSSYPIKEKQKTIYRNNKNGYSTVCLVLGDISSNKLLHRVVAMAFIPNPENKPQVNHKDGDKSNNCVSNLEWTTSSENNKHSYSINRRRNEPKYSHLKKSISLLYSQGNRLIDISNQLNIPYIVAWRYSK
jgi:hypothetical protein